MDGLRTKRALIAVYDKAGIAAFARALADEFGIEIISTGGTARHLREAGVPVTLVEQVTGFPEMLDGRVKTLHPGIHAAILADRDKPEHMRQLAERGIEPIDMVVVNLYPFERTVADPDCRFDDAIEMIDIGGPCLLRAAAKNHRHVVVVPRPECGDRVLDELRAGGAVGAETRRQLAEITFAVTAAYDGAIAGYLSAGQGPLPLNLVMCRTRTATTRYGENPGQTAAVYADPRCAECNLVTAGDRWAGSGIDGGTGSPIAGGTGPLIAGGTRPLIAGGEMSFNNYLDADAALSLVKELTRAANELRAATRGSSQARGPLPGRCAVAFIKHANACGCAVGDEPIDTYRRAYLGDPIAAAGGVLCMNFRVTREIAEVVMNSFGTWGRAAGAAFFTLDVWIAPGFDEDAVKQIVTPTEKRRWGARCRLLAVGPMDMPPDERELDVRKITGGLLVQTRDLIGLNEDQWKVVTTRAPNDAERADLRLAWLVCKHTRSNAITICRDGTLLGNGAGQMSRVKSCDLAVQLARENGHADKLKGAVAAGDAFFPVPDGPQKLIAAGVTAIIQPGGGNRDADTIAVCDRANVAMILTGTRHFRH